MHLEPGKIYGLIGANGCGKTTLIKMLAGLLPPDGGSIDYEGLTQRDITMVSKTPYLLHDSVYENLVYPLKIRHRKINEETVEYYLTLAGLADKRKQYARSLSGGEQQKLALARALIFEPKLILLDEGMSNLDIESGLQFEAMILQHQKTTPITWLIVSHRLSHIKRLCDCIFFMEKGKVAVSGSTEEMLTRPQDAALLWYLQSEAITLQENKKQTGECDEAFSG